MRTETAYDVMIECKTGTKRLIDDTMGCRWHDCFHIITWCREYSLADALETVQSLSGSFSKEVKRVWYEPVGVSAQ